MSDSMTTDYKSHGLESSQNPEDGRYYTSIYEADRQLITMLGNHNEKYYSMRDIRAEKYFQKANEMPLNGSEPRAFLEFLLEAKQYTLIEDEIDRLIVKIIDNNPHLKQHNFSQTTEDMRFFDSVAEFANRTRYRSEIYVEGKAIDVGSQLAFYLKNIYYDELASFMDSLAWFVLADNADTEEARGRKALADELRESAKYIELAKEHLRKAGELLTPHINPHIKRSRSENIFDPDIVKKAKVSQFVHSYMLTLRMLNEAEAGDTGDYERLEGIDYAREVANDPDYEAMIAGLIEALAVWRGEDTSQIEREINRIIKRDVWCCQE